MNHLLIGKKLFDKTMSLVQRSMDIRASRHRVLSSNVANIETPEYVSRDLPFQKVFESCLEGASALSLAKTHPAHLPATEGPLSQDFSSQVETDPGAAGVDIDQQMSRLAENNLMFQAGVQALIKKFEALKVGIGESR
ncbi:MAG: flagellar basal body rod protein FlgB [Syntrophaceae bacterium]|nr:flagellar basal body rod protein FlgB [Syntrophaceae bacterium]